jgi:hypothetical protein
MSKDYANYFGGCPKCGGTDGCANISKSHWYYCREHKTQWCVGVNLFSSWRHQTEAEQREWYEANDFGSYEEVEPLAMLTCGDLKPIAGDMDSYPTHGDWFAAVLAKQQKRGV